MQKAFWATVLIVSCVTVVLSVRVYATKQAKRLTDLACSFSDTVVFDGMFWNCAALPKGGVAGLVRVEASSAEGDSSAGKQVDAFCPPSKKVLGGGYAFTGGGAPALTQNGPLPDLSGWRVTGITILPFQTWRLTAFAICADLAP